MSILLFILFMLLIVLASINQRFVSLVLIFISSILLLKGILEPLSKIMILKNSKKICLIFFIIRTIILVILSFFVSPIVLFREFYVIVAIGPFVSILYVIKKKKNVISFFVF